MNRAWYACIFALAVVGLTVGGISAFRHIDSLSSTARRAALPFLPGDSTGARSFLPIAPGAAAYARFEAEDAAWRARHARQYSLSELRARGDGRRTARDSLNDRVFLLTRRGDKAGAIAELEAWVKRNPRDQQALLSLARLLSETGRSDAAIARYRQLLAERQKSGIE